MNNELAFPANKYNGGMTLRDYFAAKAMQSMFANFNDDHDTDEQSYEEYVKAISCLAYLMADAMLETRK